MKKISKVNGFETLKYACAVFFAGNLIVYLATKNNMINDETFIYSFFLASLIFFLGASVKVFIRSYLN